MEITVELFLLAVLAVSVFTGLFTEAIKRVLDEKKKTYATNTLAGIVSVVVAVLVIVAYVVFNEIPYSPQLIVVGILLVIFSWLCSMVGYDKVIQSITQIKRKE